MRHQRHHELSADAASAKGWPDVEPPHAQGVRYKGGRSAKLRSRCRESRIAEAVEGAVSKKGISSRGTEGSNPAPPAGSQERTRGRAPGQRLPTSSSFASSPLIATKAC